MVQEGENLSAPDSAARLPTAILYLASREDGDAGCLNVAGLPVAFRALMSALHEGCPSVAVPAVYRGTRVEWAIDRSERARARSVWLDGREAAVPAEPTLLVPATVVLPPAALRRLLEAGSISALAPSPPEAPVALADAALAAAVLPEMVAG